MTSSTAAAPDASADDAAPTGEPPPLRVAAGAGDEGTWRKRVPGIFVDVARFVLIASGLALIFSYIWGADVRGLFIALGVTSIVVGLPNSVLAGASFTNLSGAYALEEVTALEIGREHLAHLVSHKPLLLQDFGRIIDERRSKVHRAPAAASE